MADGSVILDTQMDLSGVKVGEEELKDGLKRMASSLEGLGKKATASVEKEISSIGKLGSQIKQQIDKVETLKQKVAEFSEQKVPTGEYKDLQKQIDKATEKLNSLMDRQDKFLGTGGKKNSKAYKSMQYDIDALTNTIKYATGELQDLIDSGEAFEDPTSLKNYKDAAEKLSTEEQRLDEMNNRLASSFTATEGHIQECAAEAARSSSGFTKLGNVINNISQRLMSWGISGLKSKLIEIGKTVDKIAKKLLQMASSAVVSGLKKISSGIFGIHKSANKSTISVGKMLKTMLKYSLGIRSLYVLFNKLRSAIVTGFENLAQYDPTGNVNESLSALKSSLTQLKNSFATAFAPILTTVAPILTRFINLISEAVTRVGMLVAALTGQKTFTKAIGVQENYAASLDKSADSANKAKKATKGYLSSLDEVKKYDDGSSSDSGTGSSGEYTGPSASDMFETVPIESSIKGIADKIKKLIKDEDWEGLGSYMADGINSGLEKIYNIISWDNVGPKITPFITAFTTTFNSLASKIKWKKMGNTVGTGINTIVKSLNLAITGIDWYNLGNKLADGIRGIVKEVHWNEVGQLLGNRFMAAWRTFSGFVHNLPYTDIGKAAADGLNGVFSSISFPEVGDALATAMNGAFDTLYNFATDFDWTQMVDNIADGINTFIGKFEWKENGKKLEEFLKKLCDAIVDFAEDTDWEAVGRGIGDFLSEIDWWGHLWKVVHAIKKAIGDLFDGLNASGTAGKIVAFLGKAFLAIKIANITGISRLVSLLVGFIGKKLIGSEKAAALSGNLTKLLGNSVEGAASGFSDFAKSLGPLVGTAGLIVGVGAAAAIATSDLAGFVETMQGGNGIGTTFGNTMNNFIQTLQRRGDIISGSAEEIWQLKENLEQEGMTAEEKVAATQQLIDKLGEMGVTSDQAEQAFSTLYQQGLITEDMFNILSEAIKTLNDNTTNMAGAIDLGNEKIEEGSQLYSDMKVAVGNMTNQLHLSIDEQGSLNNALDNTMDAGGTAQEAYKAIMDTAEKLGINTESVAKIFAEKFPEAVKETETATKESMDETTSSVETAMQDVQDSVEEASGGVSTATVLNWGNSAEEVDKNLDKMKQHANLKLGEMQKTVDSHFSSQYNTMTNKWKWAGERIEQIISEMIQNIDTSLERLVGKMESFGTRMGDNLASGLSTGISGIKDTLNDVIGKVNGAVGNINNALSGIERSFTFTYNYTNPITKKQGTYRSLLNLPKVNTVPYLASGAVIPPRSEFLAVLGDQKNGRNLEAPEDLLRQIVREEAGGKQSGGGTFKFVAQIDRRTLFDKVIEEAKLRRDMSGKNPFELT